jgi:hypothetical protein
MDATEATLVAAKVGGWFALGGAAVGALLTVAAAEVLQSRREKRQRDEDRRQLAGALAAELRGLVERWKQMRPALEANPGLFTMSAEQDYFPLYNSNASKLLLLSPQLAAAVVSQYTQAKAALDNLRAASRLGEQALQSMRDQQTMPIAAELAASAFRANEGAFEYANVLVAVLEADLLPKLDMAANAKGGH